MKGTDTVTKLKKMNVSRVALCFNPADQDAQIVLVKSEDGEPEKNPEVKGLFRRYCSERNSVLIDSSEFNVTAVIGSGLQEITVQTAKDLYHARLKLLGTAISLLLYHRVREVLARAGYNLLTWLKWVVAVCFQLVKYLRRYVLHLAYRRFSA